MFNFKFEAVVNGLELHIALNCVRYEEDGLNWDSEQVEVFNLDGEWLGDMNSDDLHCLYGIDIASDLEDQMTQAGIWAALEKAEEQCKADYEESLAC